MFIDEPFCPWSCIPAGDFSSIDFHLYLASFTWNKKNGRRAAGTVTIHDGLKWGVRLDELSVPILPHPAGVPLPTSFWMGLSMLGALLLRRRKRRLALM